MRLSRYAVWASLAGAMWVCSALHLWCNCVPRWTNSAPMPDPTSDYASGVVDGKLVIAGGDYWAGAKGHWTEKHFSAQTQAFDPVTAKWEKLPDLPMPLSGAASVVIGNRLFVLGGFTGTKVNHQILTLEHSARGYLWKSFGHLPSDRLYSAAVAVGSKIYLLGGLTRFEPIDPTGTCCTSATATDSFMVFDTRRPEMGWSQLASVPGPRRWVFTAAATEKAIWIFGGRSQPTPKGPIANFSDLVFHYDLAHARWEQAKPLPGKISPTADPPSPVVVNGQIILITNAKAVWKFNPADREYSVLPPLPQEDLVDRFVWLGGRIVGAGGENTMEGPRRRSAWTWIGVCDPN